MRRQLAFIVLGLGLIGVAGLSIPDTANAAGLVIDCNKIITVDGKPTVIDKCTVQDFIQQFVNVAQFTYGVIVLLGVLMMVYGGFQFLIAAGRQDKIDLGKRVITGTVTGLLITLTAYIIVNFTVAAITGAPRGSMNPITGIALVFPGTPDQQPFSGAGGGSGGGCRDTWTRCDGSNPIYQVYCADGPGESDVRNIQEKLNAKGCQCGNADGCYGTDTVGCVRRFQVANIIPPSGAIGPNTKNALDSPMSNPCSNSAIAGKLPEPNIDYTSIAKGSPTENGCCVVRATISGSLQPFYCLEQVSKRTCNGLGQNSLHKPGGVSCAADPDTKEICGVCATGSGGCFNAGRYWCQSVVSPPLQFYKSLSCPGNGGPNCNVSCSPGLDL